MGLPYSVLPGGELGGLISVSDFWSTELAATIMKIKLLAMLRNGHFQYNSKLRRQNFLKQVMHHERGYGFSWHIVRMKFK